jgi:hypothetical protein
LAGHKLLAIFIEYIETNDLARYTWLKRIRLVGMTQALLEFQDHQFDRYPLKGKVGCNHLILLSKSVQSEGCEGKG